MRQHRISAIKRKIGIGIIGCGNISKAYMTAM